MYSIALARAPGPWAFCCASKIVNLCAGSAFDWKKVAEHNQVGHMLDSILGPAYYLPSECALSYTWAMSDHSMLLTEAVASICLGVTKQVDTM